MRRAISLGLLLALIGPAAAQAQTPPTKVAVESVVEQARVEPEQTFVGNISPARQSVVGSAVGGRVVEFLVKEGQHVEAREPLAKLLTNALEIQRDAALAQQELHQQELNELEAGARPEERAQAEAKMLAAKSLMEYSQAKLERTRALAARRAASEDQLQDDTSAAERNLQAYLEAKAGHELVLAGPRKEQIAQAKARLAGAAEEVKRLEDQIAKHTIYSPFDGYVVAEHTEVGQWISAGDPVAEVVEVAEVDVDVWVLENFVPHLQIGTAARVRLDALPERELTGRVTYIVPRADIRSRSFPVKVRLENELLPDGNPLLKPGMFARVILPVAQRQAVLMVPKDALVLGGPEPVVFVIDSDPKQPGQGTVRKVPVQIGVAQEGMVEVHGELVVGQQVVVEGNERLRPGQVVTPLADKKPPNRAARRPVSQAQAAAKARGVAGQPAAARSNSKPAGDRAP